MGRISRFIGFRLRRRGRWLVKGFRLFEFWFVGMACFRVGLFGLPLSGAAVALFAAARK
jgi:hypothetical protein